MTMLTDAVRASFERTTIERRLRDFGRSDSEMGGANTVPSNRRRGTEPQKCQFDAPTERIFRDDFSIVGVGRVYCRSCKSLIVERRLAMRSPAASLRHHGRHVAGY